MVMLGGMLANMEILTLEAIEKSLRAHTPERQQKYLPLNLQALKQGAAYLAEKVK
jgi:2-oxoglutarate ferredoxin oxidoreductase subunit gamma